MNTTILALTAVALIALATILYGKRSHRRGVPARERDEFNAAFPGRHGNTVFLDNVYEGDDGRWFPMGPQSGTYAADADGARILDSDGNWVQR